MLTAGAFDEESPAWSPDGAQIAFIRRHGEGDVDKAPNRDLFVIDARAGAQARAADDDDRARSGAGWRGARTGQSIAYLLGDELKYSAYDQNGSR